eukprot:5613480-Prymnesium_polylepis.1
MLVGRHEQGAGLGACEWLTEMLFFAPCARADSGAQLCSAHYAHAAHMRGMRIGGYIHPSSRYRFSKAGLRTQEGRSLIYAYHTTSQSWREVKRAIR